MIKGAREEEEEEEVLFASVLIDTCKSTEEERQMTHKQSDQKERKILHEERNVILILQYLPNDPPCLSIRFQQPLTFLPLCFILLSFSNSYNDS